MILLFVLRTDDLAGLRIYRNMKDAPVVAQQAYLIDKIFAATAKPGSDRFRLHLRRGAPHQMKRLEKPERDNLVARLGRGIAYALPRRLRAGGEADAGRNKDQNEKIHGSRLAQQK